MAKINKDIAKHGFEVAWDNEQLWYQISISSDKPSHTTMMFHLTKHHHVTRMAALDAMKHGHVSSEYVLKRHEAAALGWITQVNR